jgi:hypothetical protein
VGLTWTDGAEGEARASFCDTLEAAVRFVEREGPDAPEAGGWRTRPRPGLDPAEALVQPFLRRQTAVRLRRLYDEMVGRALMDWRAALGSPAEGRA